MQQFQRMCFAALRRVVPENLHGVRPSVLCLRLPRTWTLHAYTRWNNRTIWEYSARFPPANPLQLLIMVMRILKRPRGTHGYLCWPRTLAPRACSPALAASNLINNGQGAQVDSARDCRFGGRHPCCPLPGTSHLPGRRCCVNWNAD